MAQKKWQHCFQLHNLIFASALSIKFMFGYILICLFTIFTPQSVPNHAILSHIYEYIRFQLAPAILNITTLH